MTKNQLNNVLFKNAKEIINIIINLVLEDENKSKTLNNAVDRNFILTSENSLPYCTLEIYKQGYYLILEGTRCNFKVFVEDKDSDLKIKRKPNKNKLDLIYTCNGDTNKVYNF